MKNMKEICAIVFLMMMSCQDQLDIPNLNQPTPISAQNEQGIISLAQGALYINGFRENKFGADYFGLINNFHDRMGDIVGSPFVPVELYCPDLITLDDGGALQSINPKGQINYLRIVNVPSSQDNAIAYEWAAMYSLNGAMNMVLANIDPIAMTDAKKNTLKSWAWFWKGFAYSRVGSLYYAGIINNDYNKENNLYVSSKSILAEAESNFKKAESLLISLGANKDYQSVMNSLIPTTCQVGKGFSPSSEEWIRNINTMRARNILVNTAASEMTEGLWDQVLTLTSNGVLKTDHVFTMRTDPLANLLPTNGYTAAQAIGAASNGGGGNKISERFIQEFKPGDLRFANNFNKISTWIGPGDRGTSFNTRYQLVNKGKGLPGVAVMCNRDIGAHEIYIAGFYEENLLMQAEANIYKGNLNPGLALIDELRAYQGAGLAPIANTGLNTAQAKEELRRERRVELAFRGFSFYDARRWGVLENGRTGCLVVDFDGTVHTNAKIDYGYLDYWDVPMAELFYNPPAEGSAPVINPKQ